MAPPIKKAKIDAKAAKSKNVVVLEPDFQNAGDVASKIETNLLEAYIGTVRMYRDQVDTNWGDRELSQNRKLDETATSLLVKEFKSRGLTREIREHHMHASLPAGSLASFISALGLKGVAELKQRSDAGEYLLVTKAIWNKFASANPMCKALLHAGQHR